MTNTAGTTTTTTQSTIARDGAGPSPLDEAREAIAAKGRERGFVTSEDLLESLPEDDLTPEQVEDFLARIEEHLRDEGIEVIEVTDDVEPDADGAAAARAVRNQDLLKAPSYDPVRMYLKEIGRVPLLTAAQEVDLAMRIECGEMASKLLLLIGKTGKVDQKELRKVVEAVVRIR